MHLESTARMAFTVLAVGDSGRIAMGRPGARPLFTSLSQDGRTAMHELVTTVAHGDGPEQRWVELTDRTWHYMQAVAVPIEPEPRGAMMVATRLLARHPEPDDDVAASALRWTTFGAVMGPDRRAAYVTPAFARVLGRPVSELLGLTVGQLLALESTREAAWSAALGYGLATGQVSRLSITLTVAGVPYESTATLVPWLSSDVYDTADVAVMVDDLARLYAYAWVVGDTTAPPVVATRTARAGAGEPQLDERVAELERLVLLLALQLESQGRELSIAMPSDVAVHAGDARLAQLSSRERDVLALLVQGRRTPSIAAQLHMSQSTVRNHLSSMYRKTGLRSQEDLVALARGQI